MPFADIRPVRECTVQLPSERALVGRPVALHAQPERATCAENLLTGPIDTIENQMTAETNMTNKTVVELDLAGYNDAARTLEEHLGVAVVPQLNDQIQKFVAFPETIVTVASLDAIRLGAVSFDAVKQLVVAKIERRPVNLNLADYPYLPAANVKTTSAADYMVLISGRAA